MKFRALVASAAILALPAFLAPSAAPADDLSYDDPGMHFRAPDGWERVPLGAAAGQEGAPAAVYVLRAGKSVQRTITIMIAPFDGSLDEYANSREDEIRQGGGDGTSTFILKKDKASLSNGMPILALVWSASLSSGSMTKTYEDLIIDGTRSIDVRVSAYATDIGDNDAKAALSSLYVVAYPRGRATP